MAVPFAARVVIARSCRASSPQALWRLRRAFLFHSKPRRARILLLLASKLQSLRWSAPGRGNDSRGRLRTVLPYHFLSPSESSCFECIIWEQTHIFYAWVIVYGKAHVETISHLDCLYRSSRRPLRMADPGWHQSLYGNSGTASFVTAQHRVPNCLGRSICTHGFRCRPDLLRTGVQGTYPRSAAFPCSVGVQLFLEHYLLQSPAPCRPHC